MKRWIPVAVVIAVVAALGLGSSQDTPAPAKSPPPDRLDGTNRLDCGSSKSGVKSAFHQFTKILRAGDEAAVRSVLADKARFFWLFAFDEDSGRPLIDEKRPNQAARKVSELGGLPVTITQFSQRVGSPESHHAISGTIRGTWADRRFIGKSEVDCIQGKAIVLSISVGK